MVTSTCGSIDAVSLCRRAGLNSKRAHDLEELEMLKARSKEVPPGRLGGIERHLEPEVLRKPEHGIVRPDDMELREVLLEGRRCGQEAEVHLGGGSASP